MIRAHHTRDLPPSRAVVCHGVLRTGDGPQEDAKGVFPGSHRHLRQEEHAESNLLHSRSVKVRCALLSLLSARARARVCVCVCVCVLWPAVCVRVNSQCIVLLREAVLLFFSAGLTRDGGACFR